MVSGGHGDAARAAGKARRRKARKAKARTRRTTVDAGELELPGGWLGDEEDFPDPPDEALLDTSSCPVNKVCAGCGATTGLRAVTSAITAAGGGYEVGCATLCGNCEGRSFLHMLGALGFAHAVEHHTSHC